MVHYLDQTLSVVTVLWLFPIVFMIHDFEEVILLEGWLVKHEDDLRRMLPKAVIVRMEKQFSRTTAQFATAVFCVFLFLAVITFYSVQTGNVLLFAGGLGLIFANVFTHLGQSLLLRRYTPGVATAVLVVLPYALYVYHRLFSEGMLSGRLIFESLPASVLGIGVVILGHYAATSLFSEQTASKTM